jgi:hypothetical protein
MDDDSELHFALHNTYCAEHGKRMSECIPCSRIAVNAALAAEREAMRERCLKVVRHSRGKCVSDASCEALVAEIRALEVT